MARRTAFLSFYLVEKNFEEMSKWTFWVGMLVSSVACPKLLMLRI